MDKLSPLKHAKITLKYIRSKTKSVILFYSGGKDSLVLLDLLSSEFEQVYCVFMYFIKDLEHQKPLLTYLRKYNNVTLLQYPHWMISHYYNRSYYRFHRIEENAPLLKLGDIEEKARIDTGCSWVINGAKQSDGLNRNLMLGTYKFNSINEKSKRAFPLALWKKADVISYMKLHRIIKPVEYTTNKSNGVDISLPILLFLREKYPEDYKKILKHFPLAEVQIFDYDYKNRKSLKVSKIRGSRNKQKTDKRSSIQSKKDRSGRKKPS